MGESRAFRINLDIVILSKGVTEGVFNVLNAFYL